MYCWTHFSYLYCTDRETNAYFTKMAAAAINSAKEEDDINVGPEGRESESGSAYPGLTLSIVPADRARPHENCVPLYDLKVAAGAFSEGQSLPEDPEDITWVELPDVFRCDEGLFVAQVVGESMNRRIPNGSWCLFRQFPAGTRQGL